MRNATRYLFAAGLLFASETRSLAQAQGPTISHEPITVAARGQAISVLARIRPGNAAIKTVTLYYTPSRDASPIKQPMTPTGGEVYVGTIPTTHLATTPSVHYYLEAVDLQDEWAESPWTQIQIRDTRPASESPTVIDHSSTKPQATTPVAGSQGPRDERKISTTTLIGGGVLAAGAAVAIIAAADSGGGGGGGGGDAGGDTGGDTGGDAPIECTEQDAVGTWTGVQEAPGFILNLDGRAQFFATVDGVPDEGSWGLVDCTLTLIPSSTTNTVYRGSGDFSADKNAVSINGVTFTRL